LWNSGQIYTKGHADPDNRKTGQPASGLVDFCCISFNELR